MIGAASDPRKRVIVCPTCKKRCRYAYSRGDSFFGFRCRRDGCDYSVELIATTKERRFLRAEIKEMNRGALAVHKVFHAFCRKFQKSEKVGKPTKFLGKKFQPTRLVWRWKGYALMRRIETYVEKHPEILVVRVDDDHHAGSDLVLVPHNDAKTGRYMGTSVLYVPQCTGEDPIRFFLYPGHAHGLIDALKKLSKTYRGVVRRWP